MLAPMGCSPGLRLSRLSASAVMAGLVPAIHAAAAATQLGKIAAKCFFRRNAVNLTIALLLIGLTSWLRGWPGRARP